MTRHKRRVLFVYKRSARKWGSTVMRADMIVNFAAPRLGERYNFQLSALPSSRIPGAQALWRRLLRRGDIAILTKHAALAAPPDLLRSLQDRGVGVVIDHVDANLSETLGLPADVHMACSYASLREIERQLDEGKRESASQPVAALLHHNVDDRIYALPRCQTNGLRTVYFGRAYLTVHSPAIEQRVDFLDASSNESMELNHRSLPEYNLHYCIRKEERQLGPQQFKPFTKGFTAAACGANVIVNRDVDDVMDFLTDDYPYLLDGVDEEEILAGLEKAMKTFGGPEWIHAQRIMKHVADQVSPDALAAQLSDVLRLFD